MINPLNIINDLTVIPLIRILYKLLIRIKFT